MHQEIKLEEQLPSAQEESSHSIEDLSIRKSFWDFFKQQSLSKFTHKVFSSNKKPAIVIKLS